MMALALGVATLASAQEVVRKEAPPEVRALFQALTQGANGDAAAWESFAQAHFTPELLKKQTPAQRAEVQQQMPPDSARSALARPARMDGRSGR